MKYFYAIVHKDEDSAYGVEFPDVPGCFSAADAKEDIVPNAIEALSLFFEDVPMHPDSIDVIRDAGMPDVPVGAFVVMVPYIRKTGTLTRVNLSLDRGVLDAIDQAAAVRNLTRSAFVVEATRNEIEGRH